MQDPSLKKNCKWHWCICISRPTNGLDRLFECFMLQTRFHIDLRLHLPSLQDTYRIHRVGIFCTGQPVCQWMTFCLKVYKIWWWHLALRPWERKAFLALTRLWMTSLFKSVLSACSTMCVPQKFQSLAQEHPKYFFQEHWWSSSLLVWKSFPNIFRKILSRTPRVPFWAYKKPAQETTQIMS